MSETSAMNGIIVFCVVLIIAAVLYGMLSDIGTREFTKRECQLSLLLTTEAQTKYESIGKAACRIALDNPIPIKCSRRFLTVTEGDVLKDDESVKLEYDPSCTSTPLVPGGGEFGGGGANSVGAAVERLDYSTGACLEKNVLAKEMASCWSTFFDGEGLVFQQVEQELDGFWSNNEHDRACFVCAEVTLNADVEGFADYLKSKQVVQADGQARDYFMYLAKNPKARCNPAISDLSDDGTCWSAFGKPITSGILQNLGFAAQEWPGLDQSNFPGGKTYAVTFVRYGMEAACELDDDKKDAPTMTVQVIPAENIGMYCDVVLA